LQGGGPKEGGANPGRGPNPPGGPERGLWLPPPRSGEGRGVAGVRGYVSQGGGAVGAGEGRVIFFISGVNGAVQKSGGQKTGAPGRAKGVFRAPLLGRGGGGSPRGGGGGPSGFVEEAEPPPPKPLSRGGGTPTKGRVVVFSAGPARPCRV